LRFHCFEISRNHVMRFQSFKETSFEGSKFQGFEVSRNQNLRFIDFKVSGF
jgi:hypothetical protein